MTIFSGKKRIFKNKKAIALSINFIVMLIIGIAIFAFGLSFLAKFFGGTQKIKTQLDAQTQSRIEGLLDSGNRVAIPLNSKTIAVNENDIFGLGIINTLSTSDTGVDTFYVAAGCDESAINLLYIDRYDIKANEKKIVDILIEPKGGTTPSATHICNVCVSKSRLSGCSGTDSQPFYDCCTRTMDKSLLYDGTVHKIYVKVP